MRWLPGSVPTAQSPCGEKANPCGVGNATVCSVRRVSCLLAGNRDGIRDAVIIKGKGVPRAARRSRNEQMPAAGRNSD